MVDDRPHVDLARQRVADLEGVGPFHQPVDELVVYLAVDVHPRVRRALLTAVAKSRPHHSLGGDVEIGRGRDDGGILAAHLDHRRFREVLGEAFVDAHPDFVGAREGDPGHIGMIDERGPDLRPGSGDDMKRPRRDSGLSENPGEFESGERTGVGRFEDHRIPGEEGANRRSTRQGHREVEGRDDRPDPVRPQHGSVVLGTRRLTERSHEAVMVLHLAGVVAEEFHRLGNIA